MVDVPHSLRQARHHWCIASLMPYFSIAFVLVLLFLPAAALLDLPRWPLGVTVLFFILAALLDEQWRLSLAETCSKLDARFPELQDSSALLLQNPNTLAPLAQVQSERTAIALQKLIETDRLHSFRPASLRSPLLAAIGAGLGLFVYVAMGQFDTFATPDSGENIAQNITEHSKQTAAVVEAVTTIEPPAYTGLPTETQSLDVRAPEGSRVSWRIVLETPAYAVRMSAAEQEFEFSALEQLPSREWRLTRTLHDVDFYQLSLLQEKSESGPEHGEQKLHLLPEIYNIELQPDRPPEYAFEYPQDNVTVVNVAEDQQASLLNVSVQVSDDYQLVETDLMLTLASGSGENVRFRNERIKLKPTRTQSAAEGSSHYYRFTIPAERYDIEPGDELYWYLEATDNRTPQANVRKSQHFIVRWPQEEIFGLSDTEGMAIKILPEYFRSQRQLIIDTEALLAEENKISPQVFRKRAENLAYEQNLLRMRYGRFLGEEDSAMEHSDEPAEKSPHDEQDENSEDAHGDHESHSDHHRESSPQRFGDAAGVVAAAGHQHDSSEHATLFDPQTKELLRSALNAMWSAWRDLSVIEPRASLPHQHSALRYIKEVQQASRIYLQRVGFEAPALDESRRLSGEKEKVDLRAVTAQCDDRERALILALLDTVGRGAAIDEKQRIGLEQLPGVKHTPAIRIELAKQLRRYEQQPACKDCREALSALLYRLLPVPLAEPGLPRIGIERSDYRDWLQSRGEEQ